VTKATDCDTRSIQVEGKAKSARRKTGVWSQLLGDLFASCDMGYSTYDVDPGDS
jgi:hypothetical protein